MDQITDLQIENAHILWSPDGGRLLVSDDHLGVHIFNNDGSDIQQLTASTCFAGASWSPDGSKVVYCDDTETPACIKIFDLHAGKKELLLPNAHTAPLWINSTNKILIKHYDNSGMKSDLGIIDVSTGKVDKMHLSAWDFPNGWWANSKNGKYIVSWYQRRKKNFFSESEDEGIAILNLSNRKVTKQIGRAHV